MKTEATYFRLFLRNSLCTILGIVFCPSFMLAQNRQICEDNRPFYTKFFGDDTSVFISKKLFESTPALYSMSASINSAEIDCKTASFKVILMRKDRILFAHQYDTMTLTTLDTIRSTIEKHAITQGDILIFTDIKVKHFYYPSDSYCYHDGLPMLKVIDTVKQLPRRMYMDVEKYLERNNRRGKN